LRLSMDRKVMVSHHLRHCKPTWPHMSDEVACHAARVALHAQPYMSDKVVCHAARVVLHALCHALMGPRHHNIFLIKMFFTTNFKINYIPVYSMA
jgi:hypothetical protein